MIRVSATKFRNHLFDYLEKAAAGETIIIQRNRRPVARLVATEPVDWRAKMQMTPEFLVPPDELIKPLDDLWADYV
jgi:prevent-host-death family protein